jgi:hypothetical protein
MKLTINKIFIALIVCTTFSPLMVRAEGNPDITDTVIITSTIDGATTSYSLTSYGIQLYNSLHRIITLVTATFVLIIAFYINYRIATS